MVSRPERSLFVVSLAPHHREPQRHRCEQVVEVVRDAAGHAAERVGALRVGEHLLALALLGDVEDRAEHGQAPPLRRARGSRASR